MNERIKELAKQADLYARSDNSSMLFENYQKRYTEKFAELIVRECMHVILLDGKTIADTMPNADRDNYTMVAEQTGMINGSMRYADKIKQHFGVEE